MFHVVGNQLVKNRNHIVKFYLIIAMNYQFSCLYICPEVNTLIPFRLQIDINLSHSIEHIASIYDCQISLKPNGALRYLAAKVLLFCIDDPILLYSNTITLIRHSY